MSRAPITLTRETKLLLTALGLLALLGGWMVWNNSHQAAADTPVAVAAPSKTPSGTGATGNTASKGKDAAKPPGTTVNSSPASASSGSGSSLTVASTGGKTDVITAPAFPVTDANGGTPDPTVTPPAPSGINPNQPLSNLNGSNPFRPVKLDKTGETAAVPAGAGNTADTRVTVQRPSSSQAQINSALSGAAPVGGAIPVPRIPTTAVAGALGQGGALPLPTIPGAAAQATGKSSVTVKAPVGRPGPSAALSGQAPSTTVSVPAIKRSPSDRSPSDHGAGASASSAALPPAPTPPVTAPVTGLSTPEVTASASTHDAATPAGSLTAPSAPSTPQVMTGLSQQPADGAATADNATSGIDSAIAQHQLSFNAAVLGPVNTAVFRSDQGYVVVAVGQSIPGTGIVLQNVTATSATLSAGNTTKTLQLDQR